MLRWVLVAAILLMVPAYAAAQTYDTPDTLVVSLSHPIYMYVDPEGHIVITGIIQNDSTHSYVGNVQVLARLYDSTGSRLVEVAHGYTHLEVIPPKSSSPFTIRSDTADPSIKTAVASLLFFEQAGPKPPGLDVNVKTDTSPTTITLSDSAGAPHSDVQVYVAYHDAFEPPRILAIHSYHVGDIEQYGSSDAVELYGPPPGARGYMVFSQSGVFSTDVTKVRLPTISPIPTGPSAFIQDAWIANDTGHRTNNLHVNRTATMNVSVYGPEPLTSHLYMHIKQIGNDIPVFLNNTQITPNGTVSIPWTPDTVGSHYAELFLWSDLTMPQSGPLILFRVE